MSFGSWNEPSADSDIARYVDQLDSADVLDATNVPPLVCIIEEPQGGLGKAIYTSLRSIYQDRGLRGLYRGVNANIAGNATSWGLYFWLSVTLMPSLPVELDALLAM